MSKPKFEYLKERRRGIGGGDIAALMGVSDFRTPLDVWFNKVEGEKVEENNAIRAGRYLEDGICQWFADTSGVEINKPEFPVCCSIEKPWQMAAFDRFVETGLAIRPVLEAKSTAKNIEPDLSNFPADWYCQGQWYLSVTGGEAVYFAWLEIFTRSFKKEVFADDQELISQMVEVGERFWKENIEKRIRPDSQNVKDLIRLFPSHQDGKAIEAQAELVEEIERLKDMKAQIKLLEENADLLAGNIKAIMKDAEKITLNGTPIVTWKLSAPSKRFDSKRFEQENPDLFEVYATETPGSRRFLVK